MRSLAKFIMEGKIPAELWVFVACMGLAFNVEIYQFLFGLDFGNYLPLIMLINFVLLLLAGVPLAIGILRFSYARSLLFVLAGLIPLLIVSKYQMLAFFAGELIFAYLLRITRDLGYALMLSVIVLIAIFALTQMQWISMEQKENIYNGISTLNPEVMLKQQKILNGSEVETLIEKDENFAAKEKELALKNISPIIDAIFSSGVVLINIAIVLFARWLQSVLYYPGGFKREFLNLKINFWLAIASIVAVIVVDIFYRDGLAYISMLMIPYFFVGWALLVFLAEKRNWNKTLFISISVFLILFQSIVLTLLLIVLGLIDTLVDFRKRME